MPSGRKNWLDVLALQSVANHADRARTPVEDAAAHDEEHFSRASVVKLGVAGATSIAFGLWKTPTVWAEDREGCFSQCLTAHDNEVKRRIQSCRDVFLPKSLTKTAPNSWQRWTRALTLPLFAYDVAGLELFGYCALKAEHEVADDKQDCYRHCEDTCHKRTTQSASRERSLGSTCEAPPAQTAAAPTVPPPLTPGALNCNATNCPDGVCCDCGWASGPICATYKGTGPDADDICYRNCVG